MQIRALVLLCLCLAACAPRDWLFERVGHEPYVFRDFGEGFKPPLSAETNREVGGFGGNGGGVHRTPLILVHGTTVSAAFWKGTRDALRAQGYTDDELWAVSYGWNHGRYFDSTEMSAVTLDRFVDAVTKYLSAKTGRPIRQVDIVGHSLGGTVTRHWMKQANAWHRVRSFVANSSPNHGSWTMTGDPRGPNRTAAFELYGPGEWLAALNRGGETPGATRWMTLYDGTGTRDLFYPAEFKDSPALAGADNVAYDAEQGWLGGGEGHLELATHAGPLAKIAEWLRAAPEPLPGAAAPRVVIEQGRPVVEGDGNLHCAKGSDYPTRASRASVEDGVVNTCFAHSVATNLSSPMVRVKPGAATNGTLTLTASPAGGVFEQPQHVALTSSDPDAFIVYSTVTAEVNSGMPLYVAPIYVAAPLTLTAIAIAPDGRTSAPLSLAFDISTEYVQAVNTPERQFDPSTPIEYEGRRKAGR